MATDLRTGTEHSVTELVTGIVHDAEELISQQLALFRHEIHSDVQQAKEAALSLALGAGIAFFGAMVLCFMFVHLLYWAVPALPLWVCYGIVGVVLVGIGMGLFFVGKKQASPASTLPVQSAEALKENVQWIMKPK